MTDPVERLEQWCDEQEARQMRPGQQFSVNEFWGTMDAYRRIIAYNRETQQDYQNAKTRESRHAADLRCAEIGHIIYILADTLNPERHDD